MTKEQLIEIYKSGLNEKELEYLTFDKCYIFTQNVTETNKIFYLHCQKGLLLSNNYPIILLNSNKLPKMEYVIMVIRFDIGYVEFLITDSSERFNHLAAINKMKELKLID